MHSCLKDEKIQSFFINEKKMLQHYPQRPAQTSLIKSGLADISVAHVLSTALLDYMYTEI